MEHREGNRRWFMRLASSAVAGLGLTGLMSRESLAEPQAIWNKTTDKAEKHLYPDRKDADIWVFSGQSNSQGWGMLKAPIEPDPRVMFFNADNQWVVAKEPLNPRFKSWMPDSPRENILLQRNGVSYPRAEAEKYIDKMQKENVNLGGVGAGLCFSKHLLRYVDRHIGLVYCGVGGSPVKSWDPTVKGANYEAMMNRIAMVGGKIKGLIWYQGESDATTPGAADVYEEKMLQLIDSVRKETEIAELPVLIVQIARFVWNYETHARSFEKIRDVQYRLPSLRPNVYTVSALDLPLEDSAHISFEGYERLAKRLAEVALTEVYKKPGHGKGIMVEGIEVLQPDNHRPMVRVRFSGVTGKLRSEGLPLGFEVRGQIPEVEPKPATAEIALPVVYRIDFDPTDPAAVILGVLDNALINSGGAKYHPLRDPFHVVYGPGMSPFVNIVDDKDMPIPAFGPVLVKP